VLADYLSSSSGAPDGGSSPSPPFDASSRSSLAPSSDAEGAGGLKTPLGWSGRDDGPSSAARHSPPRLTHSISAPMPTFGAHSLDGFGASAPMVNRTSADGTPSPRGDARKSELTAPQPHRVRASRVPN